MKKSAEPTLEKLIERELNIALKEIGPIKPWYDEAVAEWVFEHSLYPESCSAQTRAQVIKNYPLYIRQFIEQRFRGNLAPWVEKKTFGRGGKRAGAGRPIGSKKAPSCTVRLPVDIANWLKADPSHLTKLRRLMNS